MDENIDINNDNWIVKNKDFPGKSTDTMTAAQLLECNERTVRKWISLGKLPAYRVNNKWRLTYEDLRYFAEKYRGILILPGKD